MILVVTGSRIFESRAIVYKTLNTIHKEKTIGTLISGNCPKGADKLCEEWAELQGIQQILLPAPWRSRARRQSGLARNSVMLSVARHWAKATGADLELAAFPSRCLCVYRGDKIHWTHGTLDCWSKAFQLDIPMQFYPDETLK